MRTLTVLCIFLAPLTVRADPPKSPPAKTADKTKAPLPDRVSHEDALELENAQLKVQAAQRTFDELRARFTDTVKKMGAKYQFDVVAGDDVNFQTAVITRKVK